MAISFIDAASGIEVTTGCSVTIPTTVASGDRLVVLLETNASAGQTHIAPDGWTVVDSYTGTSGGTGGSTIGSVFTKVAGTADAGKSVIFEVTPTGAHNIAVLSAYRGSLTTPQVMEHDLLPYSGTASTLVPVPSLPVDALPSQLVTGVYRKSGTGTYTTTPPSGFTQRSTMTAPGNVVSIADAEASATGASAVGDWDGGVSTAAGGSFLIVLTEGEVPLQASPIFRRFTVSGWYPAIA